MFDFFSQAATESPSGPVSYPCPPLEALPPDAKGPSERSDGPIAVHMRRTAYFFKESRISNRTSSSVGPLGSSGAGASSSCFIAASFTLLT